MKQNYEYFVHKYTDKKTKEEQADSNIPSKTFFTVIYNNSYKYTSSGCSAANGNHKSVYLQIALSNTGPPYSCGYLSTSFRKSM